MEIIDASNRRERVKLIYRCHLKNKNGKRKIGSKEKQDDPEGN